MVDRLRVRHGRRAGIASLAVLLLVILQNALSMVSNQRELPRHKSREMDDWFHVSPRDIEIVASQHPRASVFGLIGIWYFLGKRIKSAHLTIPDWMAWSRWELERVSGLEVEVGGRLVVGKEDAKRLQWAGEKRVYQRGTRSHRKLRDFYLIRDPRASRYVVAESAQGKTIFVLPEAQYAAMSRAAAGAR
jgi:hypothetical protein